MKKSVANLVSVAVFALSFQVTGVWAAVVSGSITGGTVKGSSNIIILDPTTSSFAVGNNNFDTKNLYVFNERQNFKLLSDLTPDVGSTITAGTYISSHLIVFDPLRLETVKATISFDQAILGFARKDTTLIATNFLGAPSVTYNTPTLFGLEPGEDFLTLGKPDANSVKINLLKAGVNGDMFRVFTLGASPSGVPEPMTWAYLLAGFGMCGAVMRSARTRSLSRKLTEA